MRALAKILRELPPQKSHAAHLLATGMQAAEVASEMGVPSSTIHDWQQEEAFHEAVQLITYQMVLNSIRHASSKNKDAIDGVWNIALNARGDAVRLNAFARIIERGDRYIELDNARQIAKIQEQILELQKGGTKNNRSSSKEASKGSRKDSTTKRTKKSKNNSETPQQVE